MKKLLILSIGLILSSTALSQPCLWEGAWFYYQNQIDSFQVDYPGCTVIQGDVKIYGPLIRNLTGLSILTGIDGDLDIVDNDSLTNLSGLDNITYIGGTLTIENNPFLTNLIGLNALLTIGNNLAIDHNNSLLNLNGLDNMVSVEGSFYIRGNPVLASLEGINRLQSIEKDFYIGYYEPEDGNPSLTDLAGLDSLSSIGRRFYIQNNIALMSTNGLTNLNYLYGELGICDNAVFNDLSAFLSLSEIQSGIVICANPLLTSLYGLNNITTAAGIKFAENPLLSNLDGLENLTGKVEGIIIENNELLSNLDPLHNITSTESFWIEENPSLTSISGLIGLDSIYGGLHIYSNNALKSLEGLDSLQYIAGSLWIPSNDSLESISALDHASSDSINFLYITGNHNLTTCNGQCICNFLANPSGIVVIYDNAPGCNNPPEIAADCGITLPCLPFGDYYLYTQADIDSFQVNYPDCFQVKGSMDIHGNDISNLEGLNMISSVSSTFDISYTDILSDLTGLENLDSVGEGLYIRSNNALSSLTGLDGLTYDGGLLNIGTNPVLPDLTGLDNLVNIGGELHLYDNDGLTSLAGLNNLKKVGDGMTIYDNDSLIDLTALNSLKFISGNLFIWYNDKLQNLDGIGNIQASSINDLYISNNPRLSSCAVHSVCDFILEPYGYFSIHDNTIGCDSPEEVETACEVGLNEGNPSESQFSIFPIPSSTKITITAPITLSKFQISIFNLNGQEVIRQENTEPSSVIDISRLPQGLYFLKLTSNSAVKVFKIVKN